MLRYIFAFLIMLTMTPMASAQTASDEEAIRTAVFDYFHGQGEANLERMQRAFDTEHAVMFGVTPREGGGESVAVSPDMNEVLTRWASNTNPPGGARDGEILDLHITDGRIATVMFRSTDRFYDALTLVKLDGQWRIISKVFVRQ
jgi:hypothetical protein